MEAVRAACSSLRKKTVSFMPSGPSTRRRRVASNASPLTASTSLPAQSMPTP
jgi:hypothetical protein